MKDWERIPAKGKLIYWRKHLPDGSYLSVTPDSGVGYTWRRRGPEFGAPGQFELHETGWAGTTTACKADADRWVARHGLKEKFEEVIEAQLENEYSPSVQLSYDGIDNKGKRALRLELDLLYSEDSRIVLDLAQVRQLKMSLERFEQIMVRDGWT